MTSFYMSKPEESESVEIEFQDINENEERKSSNDSEGSNISAEVAVDENQDEENTDPENPDGESHSKCTDTKAWHVFKAICTRYLIDALTGMSQGLFVTLIAGLIIKQIGKLFGEKTQGGQMFIIVGNLASMLTGPGIGIGIAKALSDNNLVIFSTMVAGLLGAFSDKYLKHDGWGTQPMALSPGNPIGSYITSVLACEVGNIIVRLHTRLDILLVPLFMFITTIGAAYVCWPFRTAGDYIAQGIDYAAKVQPVPMSIILSAWVGLLLTLPTSSAATCITFQISGLAGGAAVTGCCCHMIGFAVASFRENGWQGLISQGIGTSMIQIPNIVKHPQILIPQVISSIILGPIATCAFGLKCVAAGSGMGTAGLVGIFGTIEGTGSTIPKWQLGLGITLMHFICPALISVGISEFMRWRKWIKPGDQLLNV